MRDFCNSSAIWLVIIMLLIPFLKIVFIESLSTQVLLMTVKSAFTLTVR